MQMIIYYAILINNLNALDVRALVLYFLALPRALAELLARKLDPVSFSATGWR